MQISVIRRPVCYLFSVLLCLSIAVITSRAQQPPHWRFWDAKDGLVEGHSRYLQIDLEGNLWITHGSVNSFSRLDGLTVKQIPRGDDFAKICRGGDGQIWVDDNDGFRKLENGKWLSYPVEEIAAWKKANKITDEDHFFFYPVSPEILLYLTPHRISIFNPQTRRTELFKTIEETNLKSFIDLVPTRKGEVWVVGTKGFAQIRFSHRRQPEWIEHQLEKSGIETLESLVEGHNSEIFLTGRSGANTRKLMKFDGHHLSLIYEGTQPFLRGWADAEGAVWLQCTTSILLWRNNRLQEIERRGPLSGAIFGVMPAENGAFWVITTQGIVRHAPAVWRAPNEVSEIDNLVHCFYEDPQGRIWAAATNDLLLLEQGKWKRFPVPDGMITHTYLTRSMTLLPNGKLLLRLDRSPFFYSFDPKNGRYEAINHPLGHRVHVVAARNHGGAWLWTLGNDGRNWLESYDGQEFKTVIELDDEWTKHVRGGIRDVLETQNGDLWIGSVNGLGLYQKGRFIDFSAYPDLMQNGAFYFLEMEGGKVWVGGRDKIYEYDGAKWRVVLQGMDKVRSMMRSKDGTVWVAAASGVYHYRQGIWLNNTEEDGLPSTIAYAVFEDTHGRIWAGTTRGLSLFHQDADADSPDTIVSSENNLHDAPPSGDVRIVFSGRDKWKYTREDRLLFSTRIDNGLWSEYTTAAEAVFKRLAAGGHRFEVQAMDRNGNVDPTPAVFEFRVLLPWYREMGFLLILGCSLTTIFLLTGLAVSNYRQRGRFIQELDQAREHYRHLFDSNPFPMWVYDLQTMQFLTVNQSAVNHYGYSLEEFQEMTLFEIRPEEDQPHLNDHPAANSPQASGVETWRHRKKDGSIIEVEINSQEFVFADRPARLVVVNDITERRELERQLQQAQKLESIGQLAAGIAHEINTPTQFVTDNTMFLRDAFADLGKVIEKNGELLDACRSGAVSPEIVNQAAAVVRDADAEYLLAEIPNAIEQTLDGTRRISKIVQSMKDFSHPGTNKKQPSDLNRTIQSTIVVAQNEWKYVAELETDFDADLPLVPCFIGEFNQVILNIIVNAAHAIAEVAENPGGKGKIRVTTRRDGEWAEVAVSDTGPGIPEKYRKKIFDPFFTTKEVGKGTGQGLAIAHRVVKNHSGTLTFETEIGKGTTFFIRLPLTS